MLDISSIHEGDTINPSGSRKEHAGYFKQPKKVNKNSGKLRIGEIVSGTIESDPVEKEAYVRLPIGTLFAILHNRLKKGDNLYFIVSEVEPSLVLKVHSVNKKTGGIELSTKEIIRILDLPDTEIILKITDYFKSIMSFIIRDEIIGLNYSIELLKYEDIKEKPFDDVVRTIQFIRKYSLKTNSNLFRKLFPSFIKIERFDSIIRNIEARINSFPPDTGASLKKLFSYMRDDELCLIDSINIFNVSLVDSSNSFYKTITNFLQKNSASGDINKLSLEFIDILESQVVFNSVSHAKSGPMILYFPTALNNNYFLSRMSFKNNTKSKQDNRNNFEFSIASYLSGEGEISTKGIYSGGNFSLSMIPENTMFQEKIKKQINILKNSIELIPGFKSRVSVYSNNENKTSDIDNLNSQTPNISVVV